jgi:3-oxoacyl-[acyl-carrier protein] reductase
VDLGLSKKRAVVVGASRGIGKAIALALQGEGARVLAVARASTDLEAVAALGIETHAADATNPTEAESAIAHAITVFGGVDILVNNVGGSLGVGKFQDADLDAWKRVLDLNLNALVYASRPATKWMIENGGGAIVHIGSICGREYCSSSPYVAAKSAVTGLTKEMAVDLAAHGIRVNCVSPGSIMFPGGSWDRRLKSDPARIEKMIQNDLPFGRFGTPDEIANVVTFLCSERSSWVSGASIVVDGAQSRAF